MALYNINYSLNTTINYISIYIINILLQTYITSMKQIQKIMKTKDKCIL